MSRTAPGTSYPSSPAIIRILSSIASSCQPDPFIRSYPFLSCHHPDPSRKSPLCQPDHFILRANSSLAGSCLSISTCSYLEPYICQTFDRKILSVKSSDLPEPPYLSCLALAVNFQSVISNSYPEYPICICHSLALSGTSYLSSPAPTSCILYLALTRNFLPVIFYISSP
jgi:hypothetical protein